MEENTGGNEYLIDLSRIETIPEIIFELSSVLDNPDARNRRVCLKLGDITLNQAQLLSIKSLINGIGSSLSSIDTKSAETEKTALSLGIIVSNVLPENTSEAAQAAPYKTAEEFKNGASAVQEPEDDSYTIVEENAAPEAEKISDEKDIKQVHLSGAKGRRNKDSREKQAENLSLKEKEPAGQIKELQEAQAEVIEEAEETPKTQTAAEAPAGGRVNDELDIIFGTNPLNSSIFGSAAEKIYEETEALADIEAPEREYTKEDIEIELFPTKYIKQTIRSGQVINYDGNIIIIGDCHPGSEITALGDITVWGVLSGIAHAGAAGNSRARVRALKMNAVQLRIADCYSRRPDALNTMFAEKTNTFTPEEARIINGEIVVFKIND